MVWKRQLVWLEFRFKIEKREQAEIPVSFSAIQIKTVLYGSFASLFFKEQG